MHQNYVGLDNDKSPFFLSIVLNEDNSTCVPLCRAILFKKTVSTCLERLIDVVIVMRKPEVSLYLKDTLFGNVNIKEPSTNNFRYADDTMPISEYSDNQFTFVHLKKKQYMYKLRMNELKHTYID